MKKIILLSISIIYSLSCMAQLTHTSEFVKINLPAGAYKLNKQQISALPGQTSLKNPNERIRPPYNYKVDNILLSLNNVNSDSINNDLPRQKRFMDELSSFSKKHGDYKYKSTIEKRGTIIY